jgi:hypothetical protein
VEVVTSVTDVLNAAGVIGMFVLIGVALHRRWLVLGWVYQEKAAEAKEWKDEAREWQRTALSGTNVAVRAVSEATKK